MTASAGTPGVEPAYSFSHRQIVVVLVGLGSGMFLAALDQTIVATALPTIVGEFGGVERLPWVASSYLLTSTVSMPVVGKLSDLYGRKLLFQVSIVVFVAASLVAGLAQSMEQLIGARALQGIGAGGLLVLNFAVVGDIVPPRERGRYQGYTAAVFATASVLGPLIGGFFVDSLSWRWVFLVNLPVGVVAFLVTSSALRLPRRIVQRVVDYAGAALLVGWSTCLLLVTVWAGTRYAWTSPVIVGLAAAAAVMLALFVVVERRAVEPVVPLRLLRNPVFTASSSMAAATGFGLFGSVLFLPLYLQVVQGASATGSGLLMLPLVGGILAGSITSGRTITRRGRYKPFLVAGPSMSLVGFVLLSRMDAGTSWFATAAFMALVGLGSGCANPVLVLVAQNAVPYRDLGVATSTISFIRALGGAFGAAVFGAVLTARLEVELARSVPESALAGIDPEQLTGSPAQIRALAPEVEAGVIEAFEHALSTVFLCVVPVAVLAIVLALMVRELPLRGRDALPAAGGEPVGVEPLL